MPRKSDQPKMKTARSIIKDYMGEETASSAGEDQHSATVDESFATASTDQSATRYSLDYTSDFRKASKGKPQQRAAQKEPKILTRSERRSKSQQGKESDVDMQRKSERTKAPQQPRKTTPSISNPVSQQRSARKKPENMSQSERLRFSKSQQQEDSTTDEESDVDIQEISRSTKSPEEPRRTSPRKSNPASPVAGPSTTKPVSKSSKNRKNKPTKKNAEKLPQCYREIRTLQESTTLQMRKLPFSRVIREILMTHDPYGTSGWRITPQALAALQESAEIYLTILFQDSYRCTLHRSRVTLQPKDIQLVRFLRGPEDPGNF